MDPNVAEVASRIESLREDMEISAQEMADATGLTLDEYLKRESGKTDFEFTFLYKCAEKLGVDIIELLTGESPHLKGYSLVRRGKGLSVKRNKDFEYLHVAPTFDDKMCEPFVVRAPFSEEKAAEPPEMNRHDGQEFDFVLSGHFRFVYGDNTEILNPGDALLYDSGNPHGIVAVGGEDCIFLAIVIHPRANEIS